jgi:hypothetical protein
MAIGRKFDSCAQEFREATCELILALRQGYVHAKGVAQLTPGDISSEDATRIPRTSPWSVPRQHSRDKMS